MDSEEAERDNLQKSVEKISSKLSQLDESLSKKSTACKNFDRVIAEAEIAYSKVCLTPEIPLPLTTLKIHENLLPQILESSQLLLSTVKREVSNLDKSFKTELSENSERVTICNPVSASTDLLLNGKK